MENFEQYRQEILKYKTHIYKELAGAKKTTNENKFKAIKNTLLPELPYEEKLKHSEYSCPLSDPNRISLIFEFYLKAPRGCYPITIHSPGYKIYLKDEITENYTIAYELTEETKKDIYPEVILEKNINNYKKLSSQQTALIQKD